MKESTAIAAWQKRSLLDQEEKWAPRMVAKEQNSGFANAPQAP